MRTSSAGSSRACARHATGGPRSSGLSTRARARDSTSLRIALPARVRTVPPVSFLESLHLQAAAKIVLTDSGGLQEEAAILNVPCVTLRTSTERPETIEIGANFLAGVTPDRIVAAISAALASDRKWTHPYGDGCSAERILEVLRSAMAPARATHAAAAGPMALPSDGDTTAGPRRRGDRVRFARDPLRKRSLDAGDVVTRFEREFAAATECPTRSRALRHRRGPLRVAALRRRRAGRS